MNKRLATLALTTLVLLFASNLSANDEKKKEITKLEIPKKPVDEAQEDKPTKDTVKGGDKTKDKSSKPKKISLSTLKESYNIKRSNLHFPPYRCFIYHENGTETEIGTSSDLSIDFNIKKSLLNIGDTIVVTNALDVHIKHPIKKVIIEQIEIVK